MKMNVEELELNQREARRALTGPALRTFFRLADAWGLSSEEQAQLLGLGSIATLGSWRQGRLNALTRDELERISYLFGIYAALRVLLPAEGRAEAWMRKPNKSAPFNGQSPLRRMLGGNVADLYVVRRLLDAEVQA